MAQFSLFAGILVCLAVAFAISALWRASRGLAITLAIALPLAAGGLYWMKGTPAALDASNRTPPKTIAEAIGQLERLTRADPRNFIDQATLARAYMANTQYGKAGAAYAKALALREDTELSVEYAEALLRTSPDRHFPPRAVSLLRRALEKEPGNQRALFFYGLHQRQDGDAAGAVSTWEKLLAQLDESSSAELRRQVAAARRDAGMPEAPVPASIQVVVKLDPALAQEARSGTVLFVFARGSDGAGPPVAAKRLVPDQFPIEVTLSDADSPMPTAKLFAQHGIVLMARLSKSGQAQAGSGDLEAEPLTLEVAPGSHAELTLSRSVP